MPAPSLPKSFLPLSVSSPAVQYRRRSGEPPTSSFSMHRLAFCWVMDHWVGRRQQQAGDPACCCWSEIHPEYQDQAALAAPAALDQVAGHWAGCKRHPPAAAKRPSAIIEACEHSWNPWCGLSNFVYSARTVWTRYRQMPAGIFYVEHMDLPKRARVPIEWPPIAGKGLVVTTNAQETLPLNSVSAAFR